MVDKIKIQKAVIEILQAIGENPARDGLKDTPRRVADMLEEMFFNAKKDPLEELKYFEENTSGTIVYVKDIFFSSICEHHLMPFFGKVNISYMPNGKYILGISKFARVIDALSKRLQTQEVLTENIAKFLYNEKCNGVLIMVQAEHHCMQYRGIKKNGSKVITIKKNGIFEEDEKIFSEALKILKN